MLLCLLGKHSASSKGVKPSALTLTHVVFLLLKLVAKIETKINYSFSDKINSSRILIF